jgi:sugar lactone lactonase YvrE
MTRCASRLARPPAALLLGVATLALVLVHTPASAQPPRSELIRERLKTRPNDPTLHYYLAMAEFAEGDKPAGLEALEKVVSAGNGFLPVRDMGFASVWDDPAFQKVRARLERKLPKVTTAREAFTLDPRLIPEGIAWDPGSRSYFIGSIATAKIVRVDAQGGVSDFSRPGELKQVLGLAIDPAKRQLHAVSTSLVGTPDSTSNHVVTYDLATGAWVRSIAVPAAVQLNDVAVGPGGELYVTDTRAGGVFRIGAAGGVDTVVAPPAIPGVNGIALAADGRALYLAHSTGIARYELATRELLPRIEVPAGETVGAIDGLYTDGNALVGIQNVTNPGRVIRIPLRADGKGAERVETLLSHHHPAIDEPTTGAIVGRSFALLATTQVARFTPEGTIVSPETLKRPVVLLVPLEAKR